MWKRVRGGAPDWLRRLLLRRLSRVRHALPSLFVLSDIDWNRTCAYAMEVRGTIWINLRGREPKGTVAPGAEYEALRTEIARRLLDLRDPVTGTPLVDQVYKREELYHGPYLDLAPDLLVVWASEPYSPFCLHGSLSQRERPIEALDAEQLNLLTRPNGSHRLNGMCMLWGEHIVPGARLECARLEDLFPTILHLMGVAIPADVDGRVLREAIDPQYLAPHRVEYRDGPLDASLGRDGAYEAGEEKEVLERLRGLGYI